MIEQGGSFEVEYRRARLPADDYIGWVDVLLTYPRDRDRQSGYPTDDDWAAAAAAVTRGDIPDDHDHRGRYAWRQCVAREGTRLLDARDAVEVAAYVTGGGTLREARGYLAAVDYARTPAGGWWTVWSRFECAFSASRFEEYRMMGVSPRDLGWFVAMGGFTDTFDVRRVHWWQREHCPDAPWRVAATYRLHGLSDVDVVEWERRRTAGEDVLAALEMLDALTAGPREPGPRG
jgi:hypothetical protein